jgi:hypothetical protein
MHMSKEYAAALYEFVYPAFALFLLLWGIFGAALGAGLIVWHQKMFRLFGFMNRYVSTRTGLKSMSMAHDVAPVVREYRYLIGACLVVGAAYTLFGMTASFDTNALVASLNLAYPRIFVAWIAESTRWFLIVFNAIAFIAGILLVFSLAMFDRIEALANRWFSVRRLTLGTDTMHLQFDKLVETFPRSAGAAILTASLYLAANAGIIWLRIN